MISASIVPWLAFPFTVIALALSGNCALRVISSTITVFVCSVYATDTALLAWGRE
nr:MAG TPA: hypothetical protein [Inoviridae sp.]